MSGAARRLAAPQKQVEQTTRGETTGNEGSEEQMREVSGGEVREWGEAAYLRGDVVRGATEGASGVALEHALSAHPEVGYFYVALTVKQHIIQL